jgi:hypothetical protein
VGGQLADETEETAYRWRTSLCLTVERVKLTNKGFLSWEYVLNQTD